jgi:hypothetical protein
MVAPPFDCGVHDTDSEPEPAVAAVTAAGGAGTSAGVTGGDGADATLVPTALVAVTWKVYVVPSVKPAMRAEVAGGEPLTVTGTCGVEPTNGVTV